MDGEWRAGAYETPTSDSSNTSRWLASFARIEELNASIIVPGHGAVTGLATARPDTKAHLLALRAHMKKEVAEGTDITAAIARLDARPFMRLCNAAEPHPGDASRTYREQKRE